VSTSKELIDELAAQCGWRNLGHTGLGPVLYRRDRPGTDGRKEQLYVWFSRDDKVLHARWFPQLYSRIEIDVPHQARDVVIAWLQLPATATVEQHRIVEPYVKLSTLSGEARLRGIARAAGELLKKSL
jgi:hypothetical protein